MVAEGPQVAGVVVLEDIVKGGTKERLERLRKAGVRTVMITGDNPLTAATIARQAGVDDFVAECTPESKLAYIRKEQDEGKLVAMVGDGTNDAPALAQADVGLAMNSGTQAAKEAGNMVDLDSDPTKLIEVVEIGKQLLMTRGALTTFSVANDVAKYFAIVPALFAGTLPWLKDMDVMHLHSPTSAILSAVIFNALIIPLLIPVALKGVKYQPARRRRAAAKEPAGLGTRRRPRAVHRHQADRPDHGRSASGRLRSVSAFGDTNNETVYFQEFMVVVFQRSDLLPDLSGDTVGDWTNDLPLPGQRQHPAGSRRQGGGLAADRAAVYQGRVLPAAAVGRVLRRLGVGVLDPGGIQLHAAQPGRDDAGSDRQVQERRQSRAIGGPGYRSVVPAGQVRRSAAHRRAVGRPA